MITVSQGIDRYKLFVVGKNGKLNETIEVSALWSNTNEMDVCLALLMPGLQVVTFMSVLCYMYKEKHQIPSQILHAAGCAAPCYARFNNGIAYGFVSGTCLDEHTVRSPEIYK